MSASFFSSSFCQIKVCLNYNYLKILAKEKAKKNPFLPGWLGF